MEIDLFKVLGLFWARKYFIVIVVALAGAMGLGSTFFMAPVYKAKSEFLMQASGGRQSPAAALGLSSLAGQFGLDMGSNQKILEIFPRVLASRTFLSELKTIKVDASRDSGKTLAEFLVPRPKAEIPFDVQLLDKVRKVIDLGKEKDGVNILTISGPDPKFTAFLANTLIRRLENYYSTLETKKALQNLDFLEAKHRDARLDLASISDSISAFKERNREIIIPFLVQKLYWLTMEQRIREEKYLVLTREFEAAKVEYEKVKPIIVVVDSAIVPTFKSEPRKKIALVVTCVLGLVFSTVWIVLGEWLKRSKTA